MNCFSSWIAEMATIEPSSLIFSAVKSIVPIHSGQSRCRRVVDLGDEILVAREDHDHHQRAGQRQIDQRQHARGSTSASVWSRTCVARWKNSCTNLISRMTMAERQAQEERAPAASGWRTSSVPASLPGELSARPWLSPARMTCLGHVSHAAVVAPARQSSPFTPLSLRPAPASRAAPASSAAGRGRPCRPRPDRACRRPNRCCRRAACAVLGIEHVARLLEGAEGVGIHHLRPHVAVVARRIAADDVLEVRDAMAHARSPRGMPMRSSVSFSNASTSRLVGVLQRVQVESTMAAARYSTVAKPWLKLRAALQPLQQRLAAPACRSGSACRTCVSTSGRISQCS